MLEAIFGLIGVVVGSLFTFLVSKMNFYKETVSRRRNVWLNEMRNYISKMLACKKAMHTIHFSCTATDSVNKKKCIEDYENYKNQVLIRLNLKEEKHKMLKTEIEKLNKKEKKFDQETENILEISRSILKEEWEKVKKETKGER